MIPLFTVVLYCFDLSTLQVNVFFQLIMLLFEAFAVIHLGDMEARYKELTKYYELTNYIANEREDFSRLLHNDVPVSYTHLVLKCGIFMKTNNVWVLLLFSPVSIIVLTACGLCLMTKERIVSSYY